MTNPNCSTVVLAMAVTVALGLGLWTAGLGIALTSVPYFARLLRSDVIRIRSLQFIEAANAIGASRTRIILRHVVPHTVSTLLIQAALEVKGVKPDPDPIVIVRGFGPSEVNLQLRVWIKEARQRRRIADEITGIALTAFAREGVEIPYPKRELYIRQGDAKALLPSGK